MDSKVYDRSMNRESELISIKEVKKLHVSMLKRKRLPACLEIYATLKQNNEITTFE